MSTRTLQLRKAEAAKAPAPALAELEREIAYEAARSDIESWCSAQQHSGLNGGVWYDVANFAYPEQRDWIEKAVRYLDLRGLLKRHPLHRELVRPLNAE